MKGNPRFHNAPIAPSDDVVRTPCPIHKGSSCMHCGGSGYREFSREQWEKRGEERRRKLRSDTDSDFSPAPGDVVDV